MKKKATWPHIVIKIKFFGCTQLPKNLKPLYKMTLFLCDFSTSHVNSDLLLKILTVVCYIFSICHEDRFPYKLSLSQRYILLYFALTSSKGSFM